MMTLFRELECKQCTSPYCHIVCVIISTSITAHCCCCQLVLDMIVRVMKRQPCILNEDVGGKERHHWPTMEMSIMFKLLPLPLTLSPLLANCVSVYGTEGTRERGMNKAGSPEARHSQGCLGTCGFCQDTSRGKECKKRGNYRGETR